MKETILKVENLNVTFHTRDGHANAVTDVSFELRQGEKLGIVGESGSGKSVTSKSIIRLLPTPPTETHGHIWYRDVDLLSLPIKEMENYRGNRISMIFQEPMVSLNPLYTVGNQMSETLRRHFKDLSREEIRERVIAMLKQVDIPSPETRWRQYPFELSGGMRQRVMIAMSLICNPDILIADEPTTALDVTIQAQILDLINKLNSDYGTSVILITHDMGVIAETVDTVAVMYAGSIVEKAPVKDLFQRPLHPYTVGLLNSIPGLREDGEELAVIRGTVPSIYHRPEGCAFHNRCDFACDKCRSKKPPLWDRDGHQVACWKYGPEEAL